jgi:hypothetical protein
MNGGKYTLNGVNFICQTADNCTGSCPNVLKSFVCHTKGNCQTIADGTGQKNAGKDCCVPGTDNPVAVSVCGQCDSMSQRNADVAVYCTVRCCAPCCSDLTLPPDQASQQGCSTDVSTCGPACDPLFNYQSCPSGYSCTAIRQDVGLGDKQLAGAYCIKQGSVFTTDANCGHVVGHWDSTCKGIPSGNVTGDGGT